MKIKLNLFIKIITQNTKTQLKFINIRLENFSREIENKKDEQNIKKRLSLLKKYIHNPVFCNPS